MTGPLVGLVGPHIESAREEGSMRDSSIGPRARRGRMWAALLLVGAAIAFKLDHEDGRMLMWLFWQRFLYRQLMYAVLIRSVKTAMSGMRTGWGKLERKGTVELLNVGPTLKSDRAG